MKLIRKEFTHDYSTYHFGYTLWGEREKKDILNDIYADGFLPYSGIKDIKNTLYMARSVRIPLYNFSPSSENRRIMRKFENRFKREITSIEKFDINNLIFKRFCNKYFRDWHKIDFDEKLRTVLHANFITHIVTYRESEKVLGYVFLVCDKKMSHYWFSFYDTDYIKQSLGMWMMVNETLEAQKDKKQYMYIGTAYGEKAQYKMNFKNIEYWDGSNWIDDINSLKKLSKEDE